jgi:DNA-binding MarR family transcriptional regulator
VSAKSTERRRRMLSEKARRRLGIPRLPLEDVLDAVIRHEAEPRSVAYPRWSRRYPEYSDALANFFMKWGLAEFEAALRSPQQPAAVTMKHVLDELRRERVIPSEDDTEPLEPFERRVLIVVNELDGKAHRKNITESLSESTGARFLPTSTAAALDSLEKRGLIWSRLVSRKADPENKRHRCFTVTLAGKRALGSGS